MQYRLVAMALAALAVVACDDSPTLPEVATASLAFDSDSITLKVGEAHPFVVYAQEVDSADIVLYTKNPRVASVSAATRVLIAVSPGNTWLVASSAGRPARDSVHIAVDSAPISECFPLMVPSQIQLKVGQQVRVRAIAPCWTAGIEYYSEDPALATVDADGLVTGIAAGATLIRARSAVDSRQVVTATLQVSP